MKTLSVRLYTRIRLANGKHIYTDPVWNKNRTLRAVYALVGRSPEAHPEAVYAEGAVGSSNPFHFHLFQEIGRDGNRRIRCFVMTIKPIGFRLSEGCFVS